MQFYLQITPYLPLPRRRSPDGASPDKLRTSNCSLLLIYLPQKDEKLSWPGWLPYSGRFTHISGDHSLAASRAQDRESSPVNDRRSTAVPRNQLDRQDNQLTRQTAWDRKHRAASLRQVATRMQANMHAETVWQSSVTINTAINQVYCTLFRQNSNTFTANLMQKFPTDDRITLVDAWHQIRQSVSWQYTAVLVRPAFRASL